MLTSILKNLFSRELICRGIESMKIDSFSKETITSWGRSHDYAILEQESSLSSRFASKFNLTNYLFLITVFVGFHWVHECFLFTAILLYNSLSKVLYIITKIHTDIESCCRPLNDSVFRCFSIDKWYSHILNCLFHDNSFNIIIIIIIFWICC